MEGESLESCSDTKSNLVPRGLAPSSTLPGVLEILLGAQESEPMRGEGDRGGSIQYMVEAQTRESGCCSSTSCVNLSK